MEGRSVTWIKNGKNEAELRPCYLDLPGEPKGKVRKRSAGNSKKNY